MVERTFRFTYPGYIYATDYLFHYQSDPSLWEIALHAHSNINKGLARFDCRRKIVRVGIELVHDLDSGL